MRIGVFGAGGVGGYFGGRLAQAGHDVAFVARGAHLAALREEGLHVASIAGDVTLPALEASDDPADIGEVDLVLVATKAWQVAEAAEAMRPMVGEATLVLPLQNGVEAPDVLARVLGAERVLGGLCRVIAFREGPGHIRHAGADPEILFGELDGPVSERCRRLEGELARAPAVRARAVDDIRVEMWKKLLFIMAFSSVAAASRSPAGDVREVPETRALIRRAMEEVRAVAEAGGLALPASAEEAAFRFIDGLPPGATSSLQRDLAEGRPSELESQVGVVVRLGRERGVATPVSETLYGVLLPGERRARETP